MSATKTGYALRKIKDAGTGEVFEAGAKVTLPEGQYNNYLAAGLLSDKAPARAADASKKDA